MDFYPAGLLPASRPMIEQKQTFESSGAGMVLPPSVADAALSGDEVDFLERLLRECSIGEVAVPQQPQTQPQPQPQHAAASSSPSSAMTTDMPMAAEAEEMVRRLQACQSPEEAQARCAEMLAMLAGNLESRQAAASVQQEERFRRVQGANGVLLRGFRSLYQRQREAQARALQAEEACIRVAQELERCQEQLHNSERAKSSLQYHLQLMNTAPGITVGGM
mmetsp:Transcript_168090/g.539819  ORF Transcript_168090/g.539819 Transcript_168090/m.539819 type:complete len:221 (-) Transcript_168090:471-1133(-)|eukprot:CAMPEP_0203872346 /NCGR_PEP_ID=MMETSP0359-20131031/19198_1 /ASSEMBLY_ACC=CAM_ASM_000338 /TAXON_ID=268821 /ORGANISM="Scrippsiella Hangoei, Strain SHTV-5" /LENGTH=220 /DNA_ID=CAMNT_0050791031 /DNA_START=75 /DNA_END=737 /DNA_ORIENTATION=+